MEATLYHYWRSSCSWRVRWALELKKMKVNFVHVDLLSGESEKEPHLSRNPMGQVPALYTQGKMLVESLSIIEFLEETHPNSVLIPGDAFERAHVRALAEIVNSGTQPIQNLPVLDFYSEDVQKRKEWSQHFIRRGLKAYQALAQARAGAYSFGDQVSLADLCLIPQCYNALRFEVDLSDFPLIRRVYENSMKTPEAQSSAPEKYQPK